MAGFYDLLMKMDEIKNTEIRYAKKLETSFTDIVTETFMNFRGQRQWMPTPGFRYRGEGFW